MTIDLIIYYVILIAIFLLAMFSLLRLGKKLNIPKTSYLFSSILGVLLILYLISPLVYKECSNQNQINFYLLLHNNIIYTTVYLLLIVVPLLFWYILSIKKPQNAANKIFKTLVLLVVFGATFFGYWLFIHPNSGIGGGTAHIANGVNRVRRGALNDLHLDLYEYFLKNNKYPTNLEKLFPQYAKYTKELPVDPVTKKSYEYATSPDLKDYVIKADMGNFEKGCYSQAVLAPLARDLQKFDLDYDLDGKVYNLACDDPALCQGPPEGLKPQNTK